MADTVTLLSPVPDVGATLNHLELVLALHAHDPSVVTVTWAVLAKLSNRILAVFSV